MAYVPEPKSGEPELRAVTNRRARLFAGGTYFRSKNPGSSANYIEVGVIQIAPHTSSAAGEAYCVVTNLNLKFDENVIGPATTTVLDLIGTHEDLWVISGLDSPTPSAHYYSISLRIRNAIQNGTPYTLPAGTDLGRFPFGKLFSDSGKLAVKTALDGSILTAGSRVFIAPRTRTYQLSGKKITDAETSEDTYGWDIADLRTKLNADNKWIEMLERSGPVDDGAGGTSPNPNPVDAQDDGSDTKFLTPFQLTRMSGGDGLPENPTRENTGPSKSLILVSYGENQNGSLNEQSTLYEWAGESATVGEWKPT